MHDTHENHQPTPELKKPYAKPQVKRVELRAEEAVLGACKTNNSAGPGASKCTTLSCSTNAS